MDKLKMHSPNLVDSNIEKISVLFPNCITETKDENGELKKAIDFDLLKQELSQVLVEGEQERYRLDWVGKKEAILTANAPIAKTLRPCRDESVDFDTTENLFIEGDNLEALKLLQENYLGKVKMIYIDPPYNTGNDFIYDDDFAESTDAFFEKSNQVDEEGNRLVANTESNGRFHSDWLNMMYGRLKLARNLLKEDGIIFVSIDENELQNLIKILEEIFGTNNHICNFIWKRRASSAMADHNVSIDHEYVVAFSKNKEKINFKGFEKTFDNYKNPDNDPRGDWVLGDLTVGMTAAMRPNQAYDLVDPKTGKVYPFNPNRVWSYIPSSMKKLIDENRIYFPEDITKRPMFKRFKSDLKSQFNPISTILIDKVGLNTEGTKDIQKIFGENVFDYTKPLSLLTLLVDQTCIDENDIVLDFFAGSGTLAQAVFEFNENSKKKIKFILVQLPEKVDSKSQAYNKGFSKVSHIATERVKVAGSKFHNIDTGFRVLKIDSTNMKDVYYTPDALKQSDLLDLASNIKEDRTSEDLLFQVMLDWGLELSLPIERKIVQGKEIFYVAGNSLVACFDELNFDVVDEVAKDHPLRFVTAEKAIHLDHDKTNIKERFKQLSPDTEVKFL